MVGTSSLIKSPKSWFAPSLLAHQPNLPTPTHGEIPEPISCTCTQRTYWNRLELKEYRNIHPIISSLSFSSSFLRVQPISLLLLSCFILRFQAIFAMAIFRPETFSSPWFRISIIICASSVSKASMLSYQSSSASIWSGSWSSWI